MSLASDEGEAALESSPEKSCISSASGKFRVIRCLWLRRLLDVLLLVLILKMVADLLLNGASSIAHNAMFVAITIDIILFRRLATSIPSAIEHLWDRGIVKDFPDNVVDRDSSEDSRMSIKKKYCDFIEEFEGALNSWCCQIFTGFIFALGMLTISFFEFCAWLPKEFWMGQIYLAGGRMALIEGLSLHLRVFLTEYSFKDPLGFLARVIVDPFLGFILGLIAWRVIVAGKYMDMDLLSKRFWIDPIMNHPDRRGGIGSLGRIYLLNISMIGIWGVLFCGWLALGQVHGEIYFRVPLGLQMLVLFAFIAPVSFILPVWRAHKLMQNRKDLIIKKLDVQVSKAIMLKACPSMKSEDAEELKRIHEVYDQAARYPVWPFGQLGFSSFILSPTLTFLGLVVSIWDMVIYIYSIIQKFNLGQ